MEDCSAYHNIIPFTSLVVLLGTVSCIAVLRSVCRKMDYRAHSVKVSVNLNDPHISAAVVRVEEHDKCAAARWCQLLYLMVKE